MKSLFIQSSTSIPLWQIEPNEENHTKYAIKVSINNYFKKLYTTCHHYIGYDLLKSINAIGMFHYFICDVMNLMFDFGTYSYQSSNT